MAALIIILIVILIKPSSKRNLTHTTSGRKRKDETSLRHCPICKSPLEKGEKVKSVLYPGKMDRMMEIYGCPHCYPASRASPRVCPVCGKVLPSAGIIYARFFQRKERAHVHVLGCSKCYTRSTFR